MNPGQNHESGLIGLISAPKSDYVELQLIFPQNHINKRAKLQCTRSQPVSNFRRGETEERESEGGHAPLGSFGSRFHFFFSTEE